MTEDEASKKWCPFARIARREMPDVDGLGRPMATELVGGVNRDALGKTKPFPHSCRCIASDCMAWQHNADNSSGWCGLTS